MIYCNSFVECDVFGHNLTILMNSNSGTNAFTLRGLLWLTIVAGNPNLAMTTWASSHDFSDALPTGHESNHDFPQVHSSNADLLVMNGTSTDSKLEDFYIQLMQDVFDTFTFQYALIITGESILHVCCFVFFTFCRSIDKPIILYM